MFIVKNRQTTSQPDLECQMPSHGRGRLSSYPSCHPVQACPSSNPFPVGRPCNRKYKSTMQIRDHKNQINRSTH